MVDDYTRPMYDVDRSSDPGPNPRLLWTGGVATALVAALVGLAGVVVIRGILHIPVLGPSRHGTFGDVNTAYLCVGAAAAAIVATALMHALLVTTPRPQAFFGWIVGLVTVVCALQPFTTTTADLETQIASSLLIVLIGLAIGTLISGVAASALRRW
ncbi:DUF6069 family protein [Saccharopolyspora montiporae]|uniref:DUF6069 family protein n=1 Tax=Saccharopolyspora montiporae TaxID=2781240 RepID=UPI00351C97C7